MSRRTLLKVLGGISVLPQTIFAGQPEREIDKVYQPELLPLGVWVHSSDVAPDQIRSCASTGFFATRSYTFSNTFLDAPLLQELKLTHLAGQYINVDTLVTHDWDRLIQRSHMLRLADLGIAIDAICIGNELREPYPGGGEYFSPSLVENLTKLILAYRDLLDEQESNFRLSYAIEANMAVNDDGVFHEWILPLIEACDVVAINLYPMTGNHWIGLEAFDANRQFLTQLNSRVARFEHFEQRLCQILKQLEAQNKQLILSETGLSSGVGYRFEGSQIVPVHDYDAFADAYQELVNLLNRVNNHMNHRIESIYIYEWWDNFTHPKIETENSPIHICFGLCDQHGQPKFDLQLLVPVST